MSSLLPTISRTDGAFRRRNEHDEVRQILTGVRMAAHPYSPPAKRPTTAHDESLMQEARSSRGHRLRPYRSHGDKWRSGLSSGKLKRVQGDVCKRRMPQNTLPSTLLPFSLVTRNFPAPGINAFVSKLLTRTIYQPDSRIKWQKLLALEGSPEQIFAEEPESMPSMPTAPPYTDFSSIARQNFPNGITGVPFPDGLSRCLGVSEFWRSIFMLRRFRIKLMPEKGGRSVSSKLRSELPSLAGP